MKKIFGYYCVFKTAVYKDLHAAIKLHMSSSDIVTVKQVSVVYAHTRQGFHLLKIYFQVIFINLSFNRARTAIFLVLQRQ